MAYLLGQWRKQKTVIEFLFLDGKSAANIHRSFVNVYEKSASHIKGSVNKLNYNHREMEKLTLMTVAPTLCLMKPCPFWHLNKYIVKIQSKASLSYMRYLNMSDMLLQHNHVKPKSNLKTKQSIKARSWITLHRWPSWLLSVWDHWGGNERISVLTWFRDRIANMNG